MRPIMSRNGRALRAAGIAACVLAAAAAQARAYRLVGGWERTLEAGDVRRLVLENAHGAIEVAGWDRSFVEVRASVTVKAASLDKARSIFEQITFEAASDSGRVGVRADLPPLRKDAPSGEGNTMVVVAYTVHVPRRCDLDIESVTGDIRVSDVAGTFRLRTRAGAIDVRSPGGRGELESVNGSISCRLGTFDPGARLSIRTTGGDVDLRLPPSASARLDAATRGGRVRVGLELTGVETKKRGRIVGTLGGGDGAVSIRTTGGSIAVGPLEQGGTTTRR